MNESRSQNLGRFVEPLAWSAALLILSLAVVSEGASTAALERDRPLAPKTLYQLIAKSQTKLQIVDVRPDVVNDYEDTHVPGALPFPECDITKAPPAVRARLERTVPTVVVSAAGDADTFKRCAAFFTSARNLGGGLEGWVDAGLPEDSGEYVPPRPGAGGGCL